MHKRPERKRKKKIRKKFAKRNPKREKVIPLQQITMLLKLAKRRNLAKIEVRETSPRLFTITIINKISTTKLNT